MRSPDCGYSSTASSRYISCSTSKSFASDAAQWRSKAARISLSNISIFPHVTGASKRKRAGDLVFTSNRPQLVYDPGDGTYLRTMSIRVQHLSWTLHIRIWRHPCDWRLNQDKAEFFDVSEITRHRKILPATTG